MADNQQSPADGACQRLQNLEGMARQRLSKDLSSFESAFQDAYEAGVIAPTLRTKAQTTFDVRCAVLHFKQVLNDLRAVWLLLESGYTSQAAAVTASLYENTLATVCLTISKKNIQEYLAKEDGELPWKPMAMAKMVVTHEGKAKHSTGYENGWRSLYVHYVWLCQTKHPTIESVIHDASASRIDTRYVVMALPNVHSEDLPFKANVAIIALSRTFEAIEALLTAFGFKAPWPNDHDFAKRLESAKAASWNAYEPFLEARNPISIAKSWFPQSYPFIKDP